MKRVLAIVLCVMMVGCVFAMAISAGAVENEEAAPVAAVATDELGETYVVDETVANDETFGSDETIAETTAETTTETTTETTAETIISTQPTTATTPATTPATSVVATPDQAKKPSPKTGENAWLWIGIGIVGVAIVAIIITAVVKKKAK